MQALVKLNVATADCGSGQPFGIEPLKCSLAHTFALAFRASQPHQVAGESFRVAKGEEKPRQAMSD
jgi:hypothetical protein